MLFLASIIYNPAQARRPDDPDNLQPEHYKLEVQFREAGQHVAGAGLYPTEYYARRVFRDGESFVVTDGRSRRARKQSAASSCSNATTWTLR